LSFAASSKQQHPLSRLRSRAPTSTRRSRRGARRGRTSRGFCSLAFFREREKKSGEDRAKASQEGKKKAEPVFFASSLSLFFFTLFLFFFDGTEEEGENDQISNSNDQGSSSEESDADADAERRRDDDPRSPCFRLPGGDLLPLHAGRVLQPQARADPEDARLRLRLR
jgi:hypothetical protein